MRGAAAAAGVALLAIALAGCGGHSQSRRKTLAAYLTSVNRIERQLAHPLSTVDAVDRQLAAPKHGKHAITGASRMTKADEEHLLGVAAADVSAVTARLRALRPPAAAAKLHSTIVQLGEQQGALITQTLRLVRFAPAFRQALAPLAPAVAKLERTLTINSAYGAAAVQQVYAQKAAALRTFAGTLTKILGSLAPLTPPDSSAPTYHTERRSLLRMRAAARSLATQLGSSDTKGLTKTLNHFDAAAALPASRAASRAAAAAVRAYNAQVRKIDALVRAANLERYRLARSVQS